MAPDTIKSAFTIDIEILTPVHVGAGDRPLLEDYDYVVREGAVWVIDVRRLLDTLTDKQLEDMLDIRLSGLLRAGGHRNYARYFLDWPAPERPPQVVEHIKDVYAYPYLPGSTLKGGLRTALLWKNLPGAIDFDSLATGRREHAGQGLEGRAFGKDQNHDLLRSVSVSDCVGDESAYLTLSPVMTYSIREGALRPKGPGFRFFVESLPPGARFYGSLSIDEYLFGPHAASLDFRSRRPWVGDLAIACRERAVELIDREIDFYERYGPAPAARGYRRLKGTAQGLAPNEFMLQLGAGAGWNSKTLGPRLTADRRFRRVIEAHRLDRGRNFEDYPKTRRLVETNGVADEPLGWIKVRMEET